MEKGDIDGHAAVTSGCAGHDTVLSVSSLRYPLLPASVDPVKAEADGHLEDGVNLMVSIPDD